MSSAKPWTIRFQLLEPVKARCVINEQLSLALLADIVSLQEDIDRAVEAVSVRDIRAINPHSSLLLPNAYRLLAIVLL
jgi:hypothetical protein